jgi:hypothetical protein
MASFLTNVAGLPPTWHLSRVHIEAAATNVQHCVLVEFKECNLPRGINCCAADVGAITSAS